MISFAGLIFAIAFMSFFIWLFMSAYNFALKGEQKSLLNDKKSRFMFFVFAFAGAWLCYWLISQNRFIYYWDFSGYWTASFTNMQQLFKKPLLSVLRLGGKIWFSDYNTILPMLIAIPLKIAGYTFTRYVMVNCICFLIPAWFILLSLTKSLTGKRMPGLLLLFMFAAFTFTPFYFAMLRGYIDVACLVPASLSMLLLKEYDALSISREQIKRDVYISALLLCTLMFRRYFAFFVEGYVFALILLSLHSVFSYSGRESKVKLFRNVFVNISVIGLFALAVMMIFFAPMLIRVLRNSYSQMYEGYNAPLMNKILGVIHIFGAFTFILAGLGVILTFITRTMRRYACFSAASLIFTMAAFFHVQSMGIHHIYTICIQVFILVCICIAQSVIVFKNRIVLFIFVLLFCAGFANSYLPETRPALKVLSGFLGNEYTPLKRDDIHELNELADYLNSMTKDTDRKVFILASSGVLNGDIMSNLKLPYESSSLHNLLGFGSVDMRDGFPMEILSADIIVVTDPVQTHLKKGSQQNVEFFADEIPKSDSKIGRHFVKLDRTFILNKDVRVYIYEKKSDFEDEDLHFMADYFTNIYPGHEDIYADRLLQRQDLWDRQKAKGRSSMVSILRWLMNKNLLTPEEIADITGKPLSVIEQLLEE